MKNRDFEKDLLLLKDKVVDDRYAHFLYAALCNTEFQQKDVVNNIYDCSWRHAGHLIAELRGKGETYIDWYCDGDEGYICSEVWHDLFNIGWAGKMDKEWLSGRALQND